MAVTPGEIRDWTRPIVSCATLSTTARLSPVRRDPTLWAFGARGGRAFADNAKYLYLHVAETHPEIRPVWVSKDAGVVSTLRAHGRNACHAYSPEGISTLLRAGAVFVTEGIWDVVPAAVGGATLVQLWHGVPLKTIGADAERAGYPWVTRAADARLGRRFALVTVPGPAAVEPLASGLRIPDDRFRVTGYPRTDVFRRDLPGAGIGVPRTVRERVEARSESEFVFAYLPTFRSHGPAVVDHVDFEALETFLAANDAAMFLKPHPAEPLPVDETGDRVVHVPPGTDPYPLLRYADALVTDYSSVAFDYLLLDRPIVYFAFDLEDYRDRRGFYFEYDSVTPGPVATDFGSLLEGMKEVTEGDAFADDRRRLRTRFASVPPGSAAERVVEAVTETLETS